MKERKRVREKLPKVSVVIPMFKSKPYYKRCLASVLASSYPNFETIVVIDGGDKETFKLISTAFPKRTGLRIINLKKRIWASGARTRGAKETRGKYVALLDHDVEVDKNWLLEHVRVLESDPSVAATQGKTLDFHKRKILQTAGIFLSPQFGWIYSLGLGERDRGQYDAPRPSLAGATNVTFRKKVLARLGYFDPKLKFNIDDLDLAIRLWISGYKTFFVPEAVIYHWTSKTSKQRGEMIDRLAWELEFAKLPRILWKNFEVANVWRYTPTLLGGLFLRGLFNLLRGSPAPLLGFIWGFIWNLWMLPDTLSQRHYIQRTLRKVRDAEWMQKVAVPGNVLGVVKNYLLPQRKTVISKFGVRE